eukprot:scaffold43622_cov22-Tisochrysis_lutea.AAC.1
MSGQERPPLPYPPCSSTPSSRSPIASCSSGTVSAGCRHVFQADANSNSLMGQPLPVQLLATDEGEGAWEDGVGEQEEPSTMLAHARKVRADLCLPPQTRSRTKAARTSKAVAGCIVDAWFQNYHANFKSPCVNNCFALRGDCVH